MNQQEFEANLEKRSNCESTQPIGRFVKNAFGVEEKVVLPATYWRYVEWLQEHENIDMALFFHECDLGRGDWTLSENAMYWLHDNLTEREATNQSVPSAAELSRLPA